MQKQKGLLRFWLVLNFLGSSKSLALKKKFTGKGKRQQRVMMAWNQHLGTTKKMAVQKIHCKQLNCGLYRFIIFNLFVAGCVSDPKAEWEYSGAQKLNENIQVLLQQEK